MAMGTRGFLLALASLVFLSVDVSNAETPFTLDARVDCLTVVEDIRWGHRIWPIENPGPKPPRTAVLTDLQIRERAENSLRMEAALEGLYGIKITDAMLQAELNRMARSTRAPERLRELFDALGNDPRSIGECLVRPALVREKLLDLYAWDGRHHGELRAQADLTLTRGNYPEALAASGANEQWLALVLEGSDARQIGHSAEFSADGHPLQRLELDATSFAREKARLAPRPEAGDEKEAQDARGIRETADAFIYSELLAESDDRLEVHSLIWPKRGLDEWWRTESHNWRIEPNAARTDNLTLPPIGDMPVAPDESLLGAVTGDTWVPRSFPDARGQHSTVWTGTEMFIWGGYGLGFLSSGSRYDPVANTWTSTSGIGAPSPRSLATAVWTGSEVIVWGGEGDLSNRLQFNDGGRYSPTSDTWSAVKTSGAPVKRRDHTAVWTGSEMIVWGGYSWDGATYLEHDTGGLYDPNTDSWTPTSTVSAPSGRYSHTAIWSGTRMIVWGGSASYPTALSTGGVYDPVADNWTATSMTGAPAERSTHTAVWTGSEMIIWGGYGSDYHDTGGRYDPGTDSWTATSTTDAPDPRGFGHTAIWTGTTMVIWGGLAGSFPGSNTGGQYNPATDTWTDTTTTGAPTGRWRHRTVWTGSEMIVWGGEDSVAASNTGARYDPVGDTWTGDTNETGAPDGRLLHSAVWTGNEMIVWGGYSSSSTGNPSTGGRYDPATATWTDTPTAGAPLGRQDHTAVWTGTEMIVWGGRTGLPDYLGTGGRYDPTANSWATVSMTDRPADRAFHTAVWSGDEMIIWGGYSDDSVLTHFNTGGRYEPDTDSWTQTAVTGAPAPCRDHVAVWSGSEMIVWGGWDGSSYFEIAGLYDPATDIWTAASAPGAPGGRAEPTAVWTGQEMIVWGGEEYYSGSFHSLNTGGRYAPATDTWTDTTTTGAPGGSLGHTAVWTGGEMIVWGGWNLGGTGSRYAPVSNTWAATTNTGAPSSRHDHTAVWSGISMLIWGGSSDDGQETGVYYPFDVYTLGGTVSGLAASATVTLQNNGANDLSLDADGSFAFPTPLADGAPYDVTVLNHPSTPSQICVVGNGSGAVAAANVDNIQVTCASAHTVGGTVSGLESGNTVVLQNNGVDDLSVTENGSFTFLSGLADGSTYDVSVLTQPTTPNQTCTVSNHSGTIAAADVTNVEVTCTAAYTVGGTLAGLEPSNTVVLQNNGGDDLTLSADGAFAFSTAMAGGSTYDVTVLIQPSAPDQTCTVVGGSGTLVGADVTDVSVTCVNDAPPDNLPLDDPTPVTTTVTYEACSTITVNECTILAPGNVTFRVGTAVIFTDGFTVGQGAEFTVILETPTGCP